jgi:hypothetical protein
MQMEATGLKVVFGFTDSTFFKITTKEEKIRDFIKDCKYKLGVIVELKHVFLNSIFYGKKNKFVAWTGKIMKKTKPE